VRLATLGQLRKRERQSGDFTSNNVQVSALTKRLTAKSRMGTIGQGPTTRQIELRMHFAIIKRWLIQSDDANKNRSNLRPNEWPTASIGYTP
jgi:hypothetical protein